MNIWDQVQKSDPASIKEVSFGRKFNAINAQHQIKRATEVFGPIGKGWGVRHENFYNVPGVDGLLLYKAEFWWEDDEADGNVYVFGISSSIATHNNNGRLDDECVKKVATDALTKGLSKLGFNADVFLGMWDDNKYVNTVKGEAVKKNEEAAKKNNAAAQDEMDKKMKELEAQAKVIKSTALKAAKLGMPDDVMGLWKDNPQLHNVKGFKAAIGKYGKQAKEAKAVNDVKETENEG